MEYNCIDCFAGAGGLALGLKRAGFRLLLTFDNDPKSVETQNTNRQYFDHSPLLLDANAFDSHRLLNLAGIEKGELFLLSGGPPCQGFSIQRIGNDNDERNDLVIRFADLVTGIMPSYFLLENVLGINGKRGNELFNGVLGELASSGYWIHREVLDAQNFGVPQRRRRIFVVGERMDSSLPCFQFPTPSSLRDGRRTVRDAIAHLPDPPENGSDHPSHIHHRRDRLSELNKNRLLALQPGQGMEHLPDELLANCHKVGASVIGHRNVYGRMSWDEVAPTITARFDSFTRGKFGHPDQMRTITLREGAILQSFPEDFLFSGSKVEIARQIGNAVPPLLAQRLGQQIIACHIQKSSRTWD